MSLPQELNKWAHLNDLTSKGRGLWTAWCPVCGSDGHIGTDKPDRFQIYESGTGRSGKARGWCRRCGHLEFADDQIGKHWSNEQREEADRARREYAANENERLQAKIKWLQQQDFWRDWHHNMEPAKKELWHSHGIGDWAIDMHKLGFTDERYDSCGGALTIPYFRNDKIQTLQFRLIDPPHIGDKYRFESGTTAAWFMPFPYGDIEGVVVVLEGAKKALVTWEKADDVKYKGKSVTFIATPSKNVPARLFDELGNVELLIWMLDPDAYTPTHNNGKKLRPAINRNIELAGSDRSLIVRTVAKIDDMFLEHNLEPDVFQNMINQAGPWRLS